MVELAIVFALLAIVIGGATIAQWITWAWFIWAGIALISAGFTVGVPAGLLYHIRLHTALTAHGAGTMPATWWLHPTKLHGDLDERAKPSVMLACYIGAAGFVTMILGCGLVVIGILGSPWAP